MGPPGGALRECQPGSPRVPYRRMSNSVHHAQACVRTLPTHASFQAAAIHCTCAFGMCLLQAKLWGQTSVDYYADHEFIDENSRPTSPVPAMLRTDTEDDDDETLSDNETLLKSAAKKLDKLVPNRANRYL